MCLIMCRGDCAGVGHKSVQSTNLNGSLLIHQHKPKRKKTFQEKELIQQKAKRENWSRADQRDAGPMFFESMALVMAAALWCLSD